jgi:hypothetical protein
MGYGAIISGLVSSGLDIYKGLATPSPQAIAGQYGNQVKVLSDALLGQFANNPQYWNLDIPGMASQSINFGLANAPQINQANMQQLQTMLGQALPGYQGMVSQATGNTQSLLAGQVPSDVQQAIQRSSAFSTLQSGAFAGSAPTGAVTARDLGLTSLQLQGQGFNQMQGLIGTARNYLMPQPVNPLSLLPLQDLISGQEWSKTQNFNATAQFYNARANALAAQYGGPQSSNIGTIGSGIQAGLGALFGQPQGGSGSSSQNQSLLGMLMGMLGSLGGGTQSSAAGGNLAATSDYGNMAVNSTAGEF